MRNWLKFLVLFIVIVVIVVAGYFATHKQQTTQAKVIQIGTFSKAIDYSPYLVAKNKGWFEEVAKKYGTTVEYNEFQSLPPINEAFATNKVDMVFAAEVPAIIGKAAGIDVNIVYPSASLPQEIVVHKNSAIKSILDLKGKKIVVLSGTSSHYIIAKALEKIGLSTKDVELIDMNPPDAKAAFESNQVDAWAIWPPFPQQEIIAGYGRTIPVEGLFTQVVAIERGSFIKEQPALNNELLGVVERGRKWVIENSKEAQAIVAQETGLPLAVIELSWPQLNFSYTIGDKEITDIQAKANFLYSIGLIKNKVDAKQLVSVPSVQ